ncbi:beta-glucoside-specific PTS transporter subunit IIABC [Priestia aryabhattai]|uniref:beta-glucoside-specific PTS transporter subunit IIABC n=1 Tax=Priestia aryabhattai TaxID=412384 RepID=UPI001ADB574C|nr:beta-glucoside-specific PTS transporter subunit IIABC [Priestia aryabhattai]QTL52350.1 PTS glucose transporter subunit IIA [Priestia aryabhattai]
MNNNQLAQQILNKVGGEKNITHLTHCATRIRMNLKDDSKANLSEITDLEGVLKAQNQNGQTQVIIGAKVNAVFSELEKMVSIPATDNSTISEEQKKKKISTVIETIAGIFSPAIPMIIAGGMIKALAAILLNFQLVSEESSLMIIMNMIGDLVFYFLPFFLAVSAAKKFKTNEYVALGLAAAYMYPTIIDGAKAVSETGIKSIDFLGLPILLVNYKSTVIPIILSVWIMSYVYKRVDKLIPDFLKIIFTAMIVILIMVPVQLIILGPLGSYLGEGLARFISWFYTAGGVFSALLLGGTRSLLTMLGMHYALAPIQIQEIAQTGKSYILVSALTANMAQAGAALGVFLAIKDKSVKTLAASSSVSAFLGITEPAMFGVNLKYKKPFFIALISSGIASAFLSLFNTSSKAYVPPSLFTLPVFQASNFIYIILGCLISAGLACILTYFYGVPRKNEKKEDYKSEKKRDDHKVDSGSSTMIEGFEILSPIEGKSVTLTEVNDQVFSQGLVGQGVAIRPLEGKVFAPFDGKVEVLYNTKHAIGLKSVLGIEVLIHVGLDTVNLEGKHFTSKVKQGQEIKVGDLILEFDIEAIKEEGYDTITPVIITNSSEYSDIVINENKNIKKDSVLLSLNKEDLASNKEVVSVS